ncbi:MAG TPA: ATP-dependent metallopeptidase FtsH/Yme1/Tma family protein, partial [Atribacterota bacterium]|nr:ATP-dependent metallopeptidase FtsH/Yme1/Tma family protein [Atribacterota bacterium]
MAKLNPNNFKNRNFKNAGLYLLILIVVISVLSSLFDSGTSVKEFTYSQFLSEVENNKVSSVSISGNTVTGELISNQKFTTYVPDDPELLNILRAQNINIEAKPPVELSWWMRILSSLLPMALIIGIWIFMMRQMQGGGNKVMSFGKSQAKMLGKETPKVTFEDVAGVDEAKEELQEIIEFLKNPAKFVQLGAKIPKGVLLYGPPGGG